MKIKNYYVFLVYFVLAICFWGIAIKFDFFGRINISGDPAFYLWSLKWWPFAISHAINPFLTKAFWAPFGQNLAWTSSCPSIAISMWPFTKLFGPVFSYNLITIISLSLSPYGIYLINKQLGLKESSSIFGGLVFFFSSYMWGQLMGHLNLDIVFVVIFLCYLYVLRFKDLIGRKIYIILFGLLLAVQFGISNEIYATFVVFSVFAFAILVLLYAKEKNNRIKLINIGFETLVGITLSIILLLPYIYYIFYGYVKQQLNDPSFYSADPLNFLIPTPITWLFGNVFLPVSSKFAGNFAEEGAYLGLPLLLIVASFVYMTFKYLGKQNKIYVFIVLFFLTTIIFSFGPYLRILDHRLIPMPWIIFSKLPFIKQALPTRFTLYVDIIVSVIAAIWFEKYNKNIVKYSMSAFAIIFLIPNIKLYEGHLISQYIPSFISSGAYKHYIEKGDNVIVLPAYQDYGFLGPIWQYKTHFYFNISQLVAGATPPQISRYMLNFFQPDGFKAKTNIYGFAKYLKKCNVKYILVPENNKKLVSELNEYFTDKKIVGGVVLYKVNQTIIHNIKEQGKKLYLYFFSTLFIATQNYIQDKGTSHLYPKYLEEHGYLDKDFGHYSGKANNWTQNGGWIGKWPCPDGKGECFGIGIVGDIDSLKPIIDEYKSQALQIFFPYPKIYKENSKEKSGQLLMIFRAPTPKPATNEKKIFKK